MKQNTRRIQERIGSVISSTAETFLPSVKHMIKLKRVFAVIQRQITQLPCDFYA